MVLLCQWPWSRAIVRGLKTLELRTRRPHQGLIGTVIYIYEIYDRAGAKRIFEQVGCSFDGFRQWERCSGCVIGSVVISGCLEPPPSPATLSELTREHGVTHPDIFARDKQLHAWQLTEASEYDDTELLPHGWGRLTGQGAFRPLNRKYM
jgi:hypothetical protein